MYPFLFALKGGLRNRFADELYLRFGTDEWWKDIRAAMASGHAPNTVKVVNQVPISSHFANYVGDILKYIDGDSLRRTTTLSMTCGLQLLTAATFGQLRYLLGNNWHEFGSIFVGRKKGPRQITKNDFMSLTKTIMEVRNDLYHHRPISNQQACVDACERLMDHLDFHLGSFDAELSKSTYVRPVFSIAHSDRHDVQPPTDPIKKFVVMLTPAATGQSV